MVLSMILAIQALLLVVGAIFSLMAVYYLGKASVHHKYAGEWTRIEEEWAEIARQRKLWTRKALDEAEARLVRPN
jgi:hypothetical protein